MRYRLFKIRQVSVSPNWTDIVSNAAPTPGQPVFEWCAVKGSRTSHWRAMTREDAKAQVRAFDRFATFYR